MAVNPEEVRVRQEALERESEGIPPFAAGAAVRQASLWRDAVHRFTHNKAAVVSMVAFALMLIYVAIGPWVSPYDPNAVDFSLAYQTPSLHHPFGTDEFGRDLFVRTALGGRISIGIGFAATLRDHGVGILYGADLRLRRRLARQRDDALPRRAVRAALPAVRDHHARDLRRRQLLDDGRRAHGRRRGSRRPA